MFLEINNKDEIIKLRSLGAGVEEESSVKITYLEAAYFAERGVLNADKDDLLKKASENDDLAKEKYFVIKHFRDRGYIIRPSLDNTRYMRLHRKGYRPGEDKTYYLIEAVPADWKASIDTLLPSLELAGRLRKELAIAVVDFNREKPTFIKFGRMNFD